MQVSVVTPATLDTVWQQIRPMIERGLSHGQGDEFTAASLKEAVREGRMQLWVAHEDGAVTAGMVLEVTQYPAKKKVFVHMVAGRDMRGWFDEKVHLLNEFRAVNGASSIEASCRPGLARFLEKRGWKQKSIVMEAP